MTEQPEALRLAYALEAYERAVYHKEAATELRRLHDEAASLRDQNTELDRKLAEMEQAGRQALEALEGSEPSDSGLAAWKKHNAASQALRERLAREEQHCAHGIDQKECGWCKPAQQEQEPYGCVTVVRLPGCVDQHWFYRWPESPYLDNVAECHTLYTAPQPNTIVNSEATAKQISEPVALETVYETIIQWDECGGKRSRRELARRIVALYTAPPAREWQRLTEEEMHECWDSPLTPLGMKHARMIEAKLKEKNG